MSRVKRSLAVLAASALASTGLIAAFAPAASAEPLPTGCTAAYATTPPTSTTAKADTEFPGDTVTLNLDDPTDACAGFMVNNRITVTVENYGGTITDSSVTLMLAAGTEAPQPVSLTQVSPGVFTGVWGPTTGFDITDADGVANTSTLKGPAGNYSVAVQLVSASDSADVVGVATSTGPFKVLAAPSIAASNTNLPIGGTAKPFTATYSGSADLPQSTSFTYSIDPTTLPTGVTFNAATGAFAADATATAGAAWTGTITATDELGQTGESDEFTVTVAAVATPTITGDMDMWGVAGKPFSNTSVMATGGTPPYTFGWEIDPSEGLGLTIDPATGAISGTVGSFTFDEPIEIGVMDSAEQTAFYTTTLHILGFNAEGPSVRGGQVYCQVGQPFSVTFTPAGLGGHTGVFSSSPPVSNSGLTLSADGKLTGTPTNCDFLDSTFTLRDTEDGRTYSRTFADPNLDTEPNLVPPTQKPLADSGSNPNRTGGFLGIGLAAIAMGLGIYFISRRLRESMHTV